MKALRQHARTDPVDRIDGLDQMSEAEADALIARKIGAFRCTQCQELFCEGIACQNVEAPADANVAKTETCQGCTLSNSRVLEGPADFSKCPTPLYKCDLCCSVAKYRCPDYYQCEKHHGQGSKTVEPCPGGAKCPLGVEHPQNAHKKRGFAIGCDCGKCV